MHGPSNAEVPMATQLKEHFDSSDLKDDCRPQGAEGSTKPLPLQYSGSLALSFPSFTLIQACCQGECSVAVVTIRHIALKTPCVRSVFSDVTTAYFKPVTRSLFRPVEHLICSYFVVLRFWQSFLHFTWRHSFAANNVKSFQWWQTGKSLVVRKTMQVWFQDFDWSRFIWGVKCSAVNWPEVMMNVNQHKTNETGSRWWHHTVAPPLLWWCHSSSQVCLV